MGVIIATGIAIVGIITSEYLLLKKKLSLIYPRIFLIKIFLATILAFIGTIFMKFDGVIMIILNLGLFVFLFFLILYFIKPFTKTDLTMLGKLSTRLSHMLSPLTKY
jgi:hypothetical protein